MFNNDFLFEISWEVCNKVGGIHTVITSKIPEISKIFKNYYCIGVYYENSKEFIESNCPKNFQKQKKELEDIGIKIHFGHWDVDEKPKVILVEHMNYSDHINYIKNHLWEKYQIDSLHSNWYDFDEAILWSWCCGIVVEKLTENLKENIFVHSHEWMAGGAIFYLNTTNNKKFKTVFTTHATMLGRALQGSEYNIYKLEDDIDADKIAYEVGVHTKFQTERALAKNSNCFTTVSNITNNEAKKFYKKKADVLLYNGFNEHICGKYENIQKKQILSKEFIREFLRKYFYNFYELDEENLEIFYNSGRNEYINKGIDIYIEALEKLNKKLIEENSKREIVSLFLIPIGNYPRDEIVEKSLESYKNKQKDKTFSYMPISTHEIPIDNEIIQKIITSNLQNKKENKVKVILIPIYLNNHDNYFNKNYYEFVCGLDLGIFPSLYEPWGYTPLESIYMATPTVTSNLSGFGRYIQKNYKQHDSVFILDRYNKPHEESTEELFNYLYNFKISKELKKESHEFAKNFDWKIFIKNYIKAYEFAKR